MCYRCQGKSRKTIETEEDYNIYRGKVDGVTWEHVEYSEEADCQQRKLQDTTAAAKSAALSSEDRRL